MFCNTQFTHSHLQQLGLTKSFLLGEFAKHQQDILFAQEQAMLPAAQAAVAHDRLVQNIDDQIKSVSAEIKRLQALKTDLMHTKFQLRRHDAHLQEHDPADNDNHQFIHRCADSECNGFVSSAWKCATCDKHTCSHCRELKANRDDTLHVCNTDTVASVALLKADTKPCPNCKVLVHKTDGCDQMFCTQCKRLWSWNTGRFETRGHNPHYLQWMRDNGGGIPRDPADVLCGREIDPQFLSQMQLARRRVQDISIRNEVDQIIYILNSVPHLRFHELPRYLVDRVAINLNPRKAFVSNKLSLHKFKQTILRNHLLADKHEHIAQIIQAVLQATTDIAFRFMHDLIAFVSHAQLTPTQFSHRSELLSLIAYANHELAIIHNDFHSSKSKRTFISHNLRLSF